jgi:hypothetical protein
MLILKTVDLVKESGENVILILGGVGLRLGLASAIKETSAKNEENTSIETIMHTALACILPNYLAANYPKRVSVKQP